MHNLAMRPAMLALLLLVLLPPTFGADADPAVEDLTITLRAGQYAALRFDPARLCYTAVKLPPPLPPLPDAAARAVARVPEWLRAATDEQLRRLLLVPASGPAGPAERDADGDGLLDRVRAREDGTLVFRRNRGLPGAPRFLDFRPEVRRAFARGFGLASVPSVVDGALLVTNLDGGRFRAEPYGPVEELDAGPPAAARGEAPVVAEADLDGDGDLDRIEGTLDGALNLRFGPDLAEVPDAFAGLDVGEAAAPAILSGKDGPQLVVGRLEGDLLLFDIRCEDTGIRLVERDSFDFTPSPEAGDLAAWMEKYYYPEEEELLGPSDEAAVKAYADVLASAPENLVDEVAFVIAHTPTGVLRVMARLGQAGLLLDNARAIGEVAAKVAYARIVEKGDRTTLALARAPDDFVEIAPEDYYFWVVHPRFLFEIPCPVDASWWDLRAADRGLTDSDWWKHEPETDIHAPSPKGVFWRKGFLTDARFGTSLFDAVKGAPTLRDAAIALHGFLANGTKDAAAIMRFGYETQDLQPWLIYAKHYGSCGEHSIVAAAGARTMLIPMSVVGCRGEDHQWNEYLDADLAWHHFDCCGAGNHDQPWGSSEGRDHEGKTVSTVTRWRGDDELSATTTTVFSPEAGYTTGGAGYTDVSPVTVRVEDAAGRPLDGALVVVKSLWESRGLVSIWGYTNGTGAVRFDLGYEPNGGYSIEAYTPLGAAGVRTFPVVENRPAELVLRVPNRLPPEMPRGTAPVEVVRAELRPPNYITGRRFRIGSWLADAHGYRGAGASPVPVDPGALVKGFWLSPEEFARFTDGYPFEPSAAPDLASEHYLVVSNRDALFVEATVRLAALLAPGEDAVAPVVVLDGPEVTAPRGGKLTIEGRATDDRRVARLVFDGAAFGPERDVTAGLDPETGRFCFTIDTGDGGPLPAGAYEAAVVARDGRGNEARAPLRILVTPAREYRDQTIRQDDPDDPLAKCSWVCGPFDLPEGLPFFIVRTKSLVEGFDMDMHVYRDGNGNGRIDGAGERVAQSAGPSAAERVVLLRPAAGTYWIHCQGFRVEGDSASLDVEVWPEGSARAVVDLAPVGPVRELPAEITFRVLPFAAGHKVTVNGVEVTGGLVCRVPWPVAPGGGTAMPSAEGSVRVEVEGVEVREWSFVHDPDPPEITILSPEAGALPAAAGGEPGKGEPAEGEFEVEVEARDAHGVARVFLRLPGGEEIALRRKSGEGAPPDRYAAKVDATAWPTGEHVLTVIAEDRAGHRAERELRLTK
jgi:hypothetical protein